MNLSGKFILSLIFGALLILLNQSNLSGNIMAAELNVKNEKNVYGEELQPCCYDPLTGYFRDGYCRTMRQDVGTHVICAEVTEEFLQFSKSRGNNLISPMPEYNFPGLKAGDKWCLCALRWKEALENNVAPPIDLNATDEKALDYVGLEVLEKYSLENKKINLADYKWKNRVILLFAEDKNNEELKQQIEILKNKPEENADRDLKIFKIFKNSESNLNLFEEYKVKGNFKFILIGKDGGEKLRSKKLITLEELYKTIDAMPMRKVESLRGEDN